MDGLSALVTNIPVSATDCPFACNDGNSRGPWPSIETNPNDLMRGISSFCDAKHKNAMKELSRAVQCTPARVALCFPLCTGRPHDFNTSLRPQLPRQVSPPRRAAAFTPSTLRSDTFSVGLSPLRRCARSMGDAPGRCCYAARTEPRVERGRPDSLGIIFWARADNEKLKSETAPPIARASINLSDWQRLCCLRW